MKTCFKDTSTWKKLRAFDLNEKPIITAENYIEVFSSGITLDILINKKSKNLQLLIQLANDSHLSSAIDSLFNGQNVNSTENKPALHTALRAKQQNAIWVDGQNIIESVFSVKEQMKLISEKIRSKKWLGFTKKPITDIVNIGIGGSHLGPLFCVQALQELSAPELSFHFISDMDDINFDRVTSKLNPETTLFIVASKSFTTLETLRNLQNALSWLGEPYAIDQHIIAVTAFPYRAEALGIKYILPIWDWVGGRYSVCSAINLITCIAIGFEGYLNLLQGAYEMDEHFRTAPFEQNLPVLLALMGIWNNNILNVHQLLMLTYGTQLDMFMPYVQQLDMESNGKSVNKLGEAVDYATGPIIWGGSANQAQHSYYQLLYQGTHPMAIDLISVDAYDHLPINRLCLAQKQALYSKQRLGLGQENMPMSINHIRLKEISPQTIGALIALYEHKVYVQSVIWQLNAFDQPGVESVKSLMREELSHV